MNICFPDLGRPLTWLRNILRARPNVEQAGNGNVSNQVGDVGGSTYVFNFNGPVHFGSGVHQMTEVVGPLGLPQREIDPPDSPPAQLPASDDDSGSQQGGLS